MLKSGVARRRRTAQAQDGGPRPPSATDIKRIAETLVTAFSNNRAEHARVLWNRLDREEREAIIDIMRVELDATTLRIIDKANWQGASFESIRNAFLFQSRRDEFPKQVCDIGSFVEHEGLLVEFGEEVRGKIVKEAVDLL